MNKGSLLELDFERQTRKCIGKRYLIVLLKTILRANTDSGQECSALSLQHVA